MTKPSDKSELSNKSGNPILLALVCIAVVVAVVLLQGAQQESSVAPKNGAVGLVSEPHNSASEGNVGAQEEPNQSMEPLKVEPAKTKKASRRASIKDVREICREARRLEASSKDIASDPVCGWERDSEQHLLLLGNEITPWRVREEAWKERFLELNSRCGGNDLESLKISIALSNLALVETWFWAAADAEAFSNPSHARLYLRGVNAALTRTEGILSNRIKIDPDDPERGTMAVPKYIESIEVN